MRHAPLALLICLPLLAQPALAADKNSQQLKMTQCNQAASGKTGDDRKAFMKACLSGSTETTGNTQQNRMKVCNSQASGKTGDDRKAFMKSCLKG